MKHLKALIYFSISFIAFGLQSCDVDDNEDEPIVTKIKGTWLLIHYSCQYHYSQNGTWWDDHRDEVVTEYNIADYGGPISGKWWDHLTFDNGSVTIGLREYCLPTQPLSSQFDMETPGGQIEYLNAFEKWLESIDEQSGNFPMRCPYSLKGDKLYIGNLYNGDIAFTGNNSFILTYKDTDFDKQGEYKLYMYTFKRNV